MYTVIGIALLCFQISSCFCDVSGWPKLLYTAILSLTLQVAAHEDHSPERPVRDPASVRDTFFVSLECPFTGDSTVLSTSFNKC